MPRGLPRSAGGLFAASLLLVGTALFLGDGSSYGPLVWIGTAALIVTGAALAAAFWPLLPVARLDRAGAAAVVFVCALVLWIGASVIWSVAPDRSWEYFNRGLVYLAFLGLGLLVGRLERSVRIVAYSLAALTAAVVAWALAGKVVPNAFPDGERIARLRDPLGYWNALALVAALALLLGLWLATRDEHRRLLRLGGMIAIYGATVAILLTYSRGGVLVAAIVGIAYTLLVGPRLNAVAALVVGIVPAVVVAGIAVTRPGLAEDRQPYEVRLEDGLLFGGLLLAGAVIVVLVARFALAGMASWRPSARQWQLAGLAAAVALGVAVVAGSGGDPAAWASRGLDEFTSPSTAEQSVGPSNLGNPTSNSRWEWWQEAWDLFEREPLVGVGAGSFEVARRPIRRSIIVVVEPHSVPIQFLAETGLIGLLLFGGAVAAGAAGLVAAVRRLDGPDRAAATALALAAAAYALHALIDYDWDFVALTGPALFLVGLLLAARRPPARAARRPVLAAGAALVAAAAVASLLSPWLAGRKVEDAYAAIDRNDVAAARAAADDARDLNPLAVDPLRAAAAVEEARGNEQEALELYVRAVELQPENWQTWYDLARFERALNLREAAIRHATRAQQLDPRNPATNELVFELFNAPAP